MKKILGLFLLVASTASAATSQKIRIDDFPYVGSLGDTAANVETQIAEEATRVCGSLEQVARIGDIQLTIAKTSVGNSGINPNGTPGGSWHNGLFTLDYPHVKGSAIVFCKK